jgi:triacylglycerol lipase
MPAHRSRRATPARHPEARPFLQHGEVPHPAPIWSEALCVLEFLSLRLGPDPLRGLPRGDGSAVILIPGLLLMDLNLFALYGHLRDLGYRPYYSGIGITADCPDRLSRALDETIARAWHDTGRRVHLIGHSLGGIFARSAAVRNPARTASVITLGTPFKGLVANRLVLRISDALRGWIRNTVTVPRECGSSHCHCAFGKSLANPWPASVRQTAIYTRCDGIVDWRYCMTGRPEVDIEVVGTHLGLPFNERVFRHIAERLIR